MTHAYAVTNVLSGLAAAAFTPGTGASDATRSYLNDVRMDRQYTFGAATSNRLDIDLGSSKALVAIALLNSNLGSLSGTPAVTITATDNSDYTTAATTAKQSSPLTKVAPNAKDHLLQFPSVTKRYWRLQFAWDGSSQTLKIGDVFAAAALTSLPRAAVYGGSGDIEDILTVQSSMIYGETRAAFYGGPVREFRRRFADQSASDLAALRLMWGATLGPVTPVLWAETVGSVQTEASAAEEVCVYGRLSVPSFDSQQDDYGIHQPGEFSIRSLGREVGA